MANQFPGATSPNHMDGTDGELTTALAIGEMVKREADGDFVRIAAGERAEGLVAKDAREQPDGSGRDVVVFHGMGPNRYVLFDVATAAQGSLGDPGDPVYAASATEIQGAAGATTGHKAIGYLIEDFGSTALVLFYSALNAEPADAA